MRSHDNFSSASSALYSSCFPTKQSCMAKEWYEAALKRLWTSALNDTGVLRAKVCTDEVLHNIAVTTHP